MIRTGGGQDIEHLLVSSAALLGKGSESEVYALDDERVLRLYYPGIQQQYVEQRHAFYDQLHLAQPPFELPRILESGMLDGRIYTVERRMRGRAFAGVLPELAGDDRKRALASYLQVAGQIGTIRIPDRPFGEMLTAEQPLQRAAWPEFLWDRLQQTYRISRADVERDVPEVAAILEWMQGESRALSGFEEKRLVHGDYFPGNVYIDDELKICGVGDFGYSTLAGDPRMDLAGAIAFLEVVDGYDPSDTTFLMQLVEEQHGAGISRWIDFYRLYYSFYFSHCKDDDPRTYAWCIHNLRIWSLTHRPGRAD
jgi:putative membrane protein